VTGADRRTAVGLGRVGDRADFAALDLGTEGPAVDRQEGVPAPDYELDQYFPDGRLDVDRQQLRAHYGRVRTYFKLRADEYRDLQRRLNQIRAGVTYDVYLTETVRLAALAGGAGVAVGLTVALALDWLGVFATLTNPTVLTGPAVDVVAAYRRPIAIAALTLATGGLAAGSVAGYRYYAPGVAADLRGQAIDVVLPHAIVYAYAMSYGGLNLIEVIRSLADSDDYGAVGEEFDGIARDMDLFGADLYTALRNARNLTPSRSFEQFLDDLLSTLDSGGDVTAFLDREADAYLEEAVDGQEDFVETLSMLSEVFVAGFVAAPLLLVVTLMVISFMGGQTLEALYAVNYVVFPLGMVAFLLLIDLLSAPYVDSAAGATVRSALDDLTAAVRAVLARTHDSLVLAVATRWDTTGVPGIDGGAGTGARTDGGAVVVGGTDDPRLVGYRRREATDELARLLSDPLALFDRQPTLSLFVTAPLAVVTAVGVGLTGLATPSLDAMYADPFTTTVLLVLAPLAVMAVPLTLFHERSRAHRGDIERRFPDALNVLSSANSMGIPLTDALALVARWSSGPLAEELRSLRNDIRWHYDTERALTNFADRLRAPQLRRVIRLIAHSGRSSGDLTRVLSVAAEDTRNRYKIERTRKRAMGSYVAIVLIGYLVYLFVILLLSTAYLTPMEQLPAIENGGGLPFAAGSVPVQTYRVVFFHSALLQGIGTGLLAGKLVDNDARSGLKYALALVALAVLAFAFV
jgi:flagellar protein FlaJ